MAFQDSTEHEAVAHVLRRCGFGPAPGEVDRYVDAGAAALIDELLAIDDHNSFDGDALAGYEPDDGLDDLFEVYFDTMLSRVNPLHERMTWYWHTHFTTNGESSGAKFALRQHQLLRKHALGNFGDLAREITTDPAMLYYLDGSGSKGEAPNENYAREFLELFALGHGGGWTEEDVRAAARILSGWHVDWDEGTVTFDPERGFDRPVTFMGERRRWDLDGFIEFVCAQPACAEHVVTRLYNHLVGPNLEDGRRDQLAKVFRDADLEIRPLLGEMLHGDDFASSVRSRTRQPLEWVLAALQAVGFTSVVQAELPYWVFDVLGQRPYRPPNVGGWPLDDRWSAPSQIILRTSMVLDWELPDYIIDSVVPTADSVLGHCGIYSPSPSTLEAMRGIESSVSEYDRRLELLFAATLVSPEFSLL